MTFETDKKRYLEKLYKPDKSKKGNVDKQIIYLVDYINSLKNYYTTSSCAGRIVLIEIPQDFRKCDVNWLLTSHDEVESIDLKKINFEISPVWFKQESFILHVCARTFEDANKMLTIARDTGFKRAGVIAANKRFILEIMSTENITTLIFEKELLINQNYMDRLVFHANKKLINGRVRVRKFYDKLKEQII